MRYTPGDATPVRGDAVRVAAPGARNWWQAGTRPPPVAFFGDVPTDKKDAILTQYDSMETFFAERFGRVARGTFYYIANDDAGGRLAYRAVFDSEPQTNVCGRSFDGVAIVVLNCEITNALGERRAIEQQDPYLRAYIYSEQALGAVPAGTAATHPAWLTRGLSSYARLLYHASIGVEDYANTRTQALRAARRTALALREIDEDNARDDGVRDLAFLALEWLTAEADDAIARYHHLLRTFMYWTRSFEAAFGMSIDDFHVSFEAYRAEHFAPDAHRVEDEAGGPSLVFLGDVAADVREEVEAELESVQAFFLERFEAKLPAYTIYAGADTDAVREAFPAYSFSGRCGDRLWQAQTIIALNRCGEWRLDAFAAQARTSANGSSPGPGPFPPWLYEGAERYATREYRIAPAPSTATGARPS